MTQRALALSLPRLSGETRFSWQERNHLFKHPPGHVPTPVLLARTLKRQAREVMDAVTTCPPDTIPAHLARLDDWLEIARHLIAHDLANLPDARRSGVQLIHPATLADYIAAVEITRRDLRSPSFLGATQQELAQINAKLDMLAGLLGRPQLMAAIEAAEESAVIE